MSAKTLVFLVLGTCLVFTLCVKSVFSEEITINSNITENTSSIRKRWKPVNIVLSDSKVMDGSLLTTAPLNTRTLLPPQNLTAQLQGDDILVDWDAPVAGSQLLELGNDNGNITPIFSWFVGDIIATKLTASQENYPATLQAVKFPLYWEEGMDTSAGLQVQVYSVGPTGSPDNLLGSLNLPAVSTFYPDWVEADFSEQQIEITGSFFAAVKYTGDVNVVAPIVSSDNNTNIPLGINYFYDSLEQTWFEHYDFYSLYGEDGATIGYNMIRADILANGEVLEILGYNVYRDGGLIGDVNEDGVTSFLDVDPGMGTWTYHATANYAEGESPASNAAAVTIEYPDIAAYPDSIGWGPIPVNSGIADSFALTNEGNVTLNIYGLSVDTPFSVVNGDLSIAPGDTAWITITFNPTSVGTFADSVEITSDDPDENPYYVAVSGSAEEEPQGDLVTGTATINIYDWGNADYFDFSLQQVAADTVDPDYVPDFRGTQNEGVNFGNEGTLIGGRRILRYSESGNIENVATVPQWTNTVPWVEVSWDWPNGTSGAPISVGEIWVVYTREGHYALMEITEVINSYPDYNFTFDYKYQPNGTTDFTGGTSSSEFALQFDGINDYVALENQILLAEKSNFTLELWYKGTDTDANYPWGKCLIGRNNTDIYSELVIKNGYAGYAHYYGGWQQNIISSTFIADNQWHHIAFVHRSDSRGDLYVDGVKEVDDEPASTGGVPLMIDGFMIGYQNQFTTGTIGRVRIWDVTRTEEEIQNSMNQFLTGTEDGLIGYWLLDNFEDLGIGYAGENDVRDYSANENHGDVVGGAQLVDWEFWEAPDIAAYPDSIGWGPIPVNSGITDSFALTNEGNITLNIYGLSVDAPFSVVNGDLSIAPGDTAWITISFNPTSTGSFADSITISSDDPDENPYYVAVSGSAEEESQGDLVTGTATINIYGWGNADFFDFSLQQVASDTSDPDYIPDFRGTQNEGVNFGNEGTLIGGRRILRYSESGNIENVATVPQWTNTVPWVEVSWDWPNGTSGAPISVGEIWVVYTREGHYALMEITEVINSYPDYNFTFDYKYQSNGTTDFTGQPPGDTTPPAAVDDLTVDDFPALGELILNWTATGDDGMEGIATNYEIRYSTSLDSLENQFDAIALIENLPTPSESGLRDTIHVTDLANRTTYYFAMKVVDEEGNKSALSNIIAVVTPGLIVTESYIPTYWSASQHGTVYVRHSIVITDSITIEAGVQVDCAIGEEIVVHPGGRIVSIGTSENQIRWRGYGRWRGIIFNGSADNCVFEHVIIDSIEAGFPAFRFVSGRPIIRRSRLNSHIVCDSIQQANPTLDECTFVSRVGYARYPIYGGPMTQIINCDFSNWQGYNGIRIYGGTISRAITWYYYPDFPYYISGNIRVSGNIWTVRPNTRVFFTSSDTLIVDSGGLVLGDDTAPGDSVYLSCTCPQGGYWGGIVINSAVTTVNLRYVVVHRARNIYYDGGIPRYFAIRFHNAGYDTTKVIAYSTIHVDEGVYPILLINSSPRLIYNRFYGTIFGTDYRSNPIIRYCNFFGIGSYPVYAGPMVVIQGCGFAGWTCSGRCGFWIYGGEITRSVTWHYNVGYPYWVKGNIYVYDGGWLIRPRVRVYYDVEVEVVVGTQGRPGRLVINATTDADSVVFVCDPDTLTKFWKGIRITQYVTEVNLRRIVIRRARGIFNDDGVDRYFGVCFHDMGDSTQLIQYSRIDTIFTNVVGVYGYPILLINSNPKLISNRYHGRIYSTNGTSNPIISGGWWYGTGHYPIYVGPRTIYRGTLYFTGWTNARAFWIWGGTINVDVVWNPVHVVGYTYLPYYFVDDVTVCCNARLRLSPGVRSRWRNGKRLRIGDPDGNTIGKLICEGAEADSIYFETDIEDTTQRWGGIVVTSKADTVKIEYAVIRYARGVYNDNGTERRFGLCFHDAEVDTLKKIVRRCRIIVDPTVENYPILLINSSPLLAYNTYHGSLYCTDGTSNPVIRGGRWIGSIGYPIYTGAMTIFDCSCHDFTRWTGRRQIWFWGTTITRNTRWRYIPGLPYYCHDDVVVDGDVTLTVIKKVYVYYNVNKILRIRNSGKLYCVGGSDPDSTDFIAFNCSKPDSFWGGLRFDDTAGKSRVSRTLLRRGGGIKEDDEDYGAVITTASEDSLELDHLVIAQPKGHGVRFRKKNSRTRFHSSIITEVGTDNPDSLDTAPVITEADDDSTMIDHNLVVNNPNNDIENLKGKKGGCTNNELPNTLPFLVEGDSTYRIAPNSIIRNTGSEGTSVGLYDYEDTQEPSEVENPQVVRRGNGSSRIRFNSAGDDSTFGRAKHADVRWSTEDITEENWDDLTEGTTITTPEHASDCAVDEIVVPGLNKEKRHRFGFRARDEVGNRSGLIVVEAEYQLAITPDSLWFGGVAIGTTDTMEITLANIGEDTLNISGIQFGSSGAYAVRDTSFIILAGEEFSTQVYFTPTIEDSFPDTMNVYYGDDFNPLPIFGIGTPKVILSEDNYAHWQINDGNTPNNAIAQITNLTLGDTYAYQARLYQSAGQYASYTYADGWNVPEDGIQATFTAASSDTNLSVYYKSNGSMIPDEEIGEDWYLSVNVKNLTKDVWSPNLNLPISIGSSTTADTLYDMGWIEGFLEDNSDGSGRAPMRGARVMLRGSPLNSLYDTEINNIDEGYPDTDGYFRVAIPAGHQMEELEFRYPDNSLMAVVNVSQNPQFAIDAGEMVNIGTYYFGGDVLIADGYFIPGASYSSFIELANTSLPFDTIKIDLTLDEELLDLANISLTPKYQGIVELESSYADGSLEIILSNPQHIVLIGDIIQLDVDVSASANLGESTVIAFEQVSAKAITTEIMLGTNDGNFCFITAENQPDIIAEQDTVSISLLTGELTTETLTLTGVGEIPAAFTLEAPDVSWFSVSPQTHTLSGCESIDIELNFDAQEDTPGFYELDLIIQGDIAPYDIVHIQLTISGLNIQHPDILSIQKLISKLGAQKFLSPKYDAAYDENGDGIINETDLKLMIARWGE